MTLPFLVTAGAIWHKVWPFLIAILFFGVIIFIHEFGHFIFAKLFGVKVNEFALGMGPTLLKKQGKETKYALHLFPIGGYCAMEGEDESSDDDRAFCNKKVWQRIIIVAAGATFNLILGLIISCILIGVDGDYVGTRQILRFYDTAISNTADGLMAGDEILEIDDKHVFSDYDITYLMQRGNTGAYHMVVRRDGEKVDLPAVHFNVRTGGNFSYKEDNSIHDLSAKMKKAGLKDGDFTIRGSLKELEAELSPMDFAECSNCYLVNLRYVDSLSGDTCLVKGVELPISKTRKKDFTSKFLDSIA